MANTLTDYTGVEWKVHETSWDSAPVCPYTARIKRLTERLDEVLGMVVESEGDRLVTEVRIQNAITNLQVERDEWREKQEAERAARMAKFNEAEVERLREREAELEKALLRPRRWFGR